MHRLSIWIAGLAVVALIAISIGVNVNFGYRIGGLFLGGLSGAIDFLKIAMPALIVLACCASGSRWVRAAVVAMALLVWVPCTLWGLQSATSAALLLRADYAGERQATVDKRQRLAEERSKLTAKSPWSAEIQAWRDKPSQAIAREIEAYKESKAWSATAKCASADTGEELKYCRTYRLMQAAQETASQAERDGIRLEQVERDLAAVPGTTESDPSAKEIAAFLGLTKQQVVNFWAAMVAFILEFVPNVGPALLMLANRLDARKAPSQEIAPKPMEVSKPVPAPEVEAKPEPVHQPVPMPARSPQRVPKPRQAPDVAPVVAAAQSFGQGQWTLAKLQREVAAQAKVTGLKPPGYARIGVILHQHGWVRCGRTEDMGRRTIIYERRMSCLN